MQPRAPKCEVFPASSAKWGSARKISATLSSLRSRRRQGAKPAPRRCARPSLRVLDCVLAPAWFLLEELALLSVPNPASMIAMEERNC